MPTRNKKSPPSDPPPAAPAALPGPVSLFATKIVTDPRRCFCGSDRLHTACLTTAVAKLIEAGFIVHAMHPDFGGWLTAGPSATAESGFAAVSHGGTSDVGCEAFYGPADLARYFVEQVGKNSAHVGVRQAETKVAA